MRLNYRLDGGVELARQLERLEKQLSRDIKVDALQQAAEPIRSRAATLAPKDERANAPHLADNIVIGTLTDNRLERQGRATETVVEVGPRAGKSGNDFFYGYMQEYGTAHHSAQPFMRPAFDFEHVEALNILMDELWWSLRRGLPTGNETFVP